MSKSSHASLSLSSGPNREIVEPPTSLGTENGINISSQVPLNGAAGDAPSLPCAEVLPRAARRSFSTPEKLRILREVDLCPPGQIGPLLRREGIYSSHLIRWQKKRDSGALLALSPKKRGPIPSVNPLAKRVAELERIERSLLARLAQAEAIIDIQKKVADILGITLKTLPNGDNG